MANDSFETAGTNQGEAANWDIDSVAGGFGFGAVNDATTTFDSAESFEKTWYLSMRVHQQADTANEETTANASDEATAVALANSLKYKYRAHRTNHADVHIDPDVINYVSVDKATDTASAILLANAIKSAYNAHVWSYPSVHRKWDSQYVVATADATDLSSLIALLNDLKTKYNLHIALVTYGDSNDAALFSFESAHLAAGSYHGDITAESFEQGFAIPDILPLVKPAEPDRQEEQADMVSVDDPGNVSWPEGHVQFLNFFSYLETESGIIDSFESHWYLPGSNSGYNNLWFVMSYFDEATGTFRFGADALASGITDTFESDWRHNQDGFAAYYDGSQWRFTASQVELFDITVEDFDQAEWTLILE